MPLRDSKRIRGSIFIVAVWAILLLSTLAISLAEAVLQKISFFQHIEAREESRQLAESTINSVLSELLLWQQDGFIPKEHVRDLASLSFGNETFKHANVRYWVTDETVKLNVNAADIEALKNLLRLKTKLNESELGELASEIVDFRDGDDFILNYYDKGSEKFSYERAGLAYVPKNGPLEYLGELRYVKGMTETIFKAIEPFVTVYGVSGINLNKADYDMMTVIGITSETASKIVSLRNGFDGREGTADDEYFSSVDQLMDRIRQEDKEVPKDIDHMYDLAASNCFTFQPDYFKIVAEVEPLKKHAKRSRTVCIFGLKDGYRYWAET